MRKYWILVAGLFFFTFAHAQTLATVNGTKVEEAIVKAWLRTQGIAAPSAEQVKQAIPVFENRLLLAQQAEASNMVAAKTLETLLDAYKVNILSQAAIDHHLASNMPTESAIKARYKAIVANQPPELFRIRMIVVKTQDDATKVLDRLKSGASFSNLAAEHSIDQGSAMLGGEVGWRAPAKLPPAIDAAILKIKPGQVTGPIEVNGAYVVMQLMQKKANVVPSLDELRTAIMNELKDESVNSYVISLRKKATISPADNASSISEKAASPGHSSNAP